MIILLAVLALIVVNALRRQRLGRLHHRLHHPDRAADGLVDAPLPAREGTLEASAIGVALVLLAVVAGGWVAASPTLAPMFTWSATSSARHGGLRLRRLRPAGLDPALPARLPLDLPEDRRPSACSRSASCSTLPPIHMPATTRFIDGTGPIFAGKLFPFAFITIACGAISGFHALVASGTTPKMLTPRGRRAAGRLRRDADGELRGGDGDHRRLDPGAGRLLRDQRAGAARSGGTLAQAAAAMLQLGLHRDARAHAARSPPRWARSRCSRAPAARPRWRWGWRRSSAAPSAGRR